MFLLCLDDWPVWVMSVVSLSKDARARAPCSKVCHNNGLMTPILPVIKLSFVSNTPQIFLQSYMMNPIILNLM